MIAMEYKRTPAISGYRLNTRHGRLKDLRWRKGVTQAAIAERLGFVASYYNKIENNDNLQVEYPILVKLADFLNTTPEYITIGDNSDTRPEPKAAAAAIPYDADSVVYLPFIPVSARAGQSRPYGGELPVVNETFGVYKERLPRNHSDCVVIEIDGDSMEDTLHPGDRVLARLLDRGAWPEHNKIVAVVTEGGFMVKRVSFWLDDRLVLTSDNPAGEKTIVIEKKNIVNLYAVIRLIDRSL